MALISRESSRSLEMENDVHSRDIVLGMLKACASWCVDGRNIFRKYKVVEPSVLVGTHRMCTRTLHM